MTAPAASRLLIVLVNTDPRNAEELGAPFYHAAVAAAMDYEVDVVCTATAGKLMRQGRRRGHPSRPATRDRLRLDQGGARATARGSGPARPTSICSIWPRRT